MGNEFEWERRTLSDQKLSPLDGMKGKSFLFVLLKNSLLCWPLIDQQMDKWILHKFSAFIMFNGEL